MWEWNKRHGKILEAIVYNFHKSDIRYFILRNYEGLPDENSSKDVDIIVDPKKINEANNIVQQIYNKSGLTHRYLVRYTWVYCWHGMDVSSHMSIHIDLIAGYRVKGYEVFTFDQLYEQTKVFNGFVVLNELYEGIMLLVYKQFGYKKPFLKNEYRCVIKKTCSRYPVFKEVLEKVVGCGMACQIINSILSDDFNAIYRLAPHFSAKLKKYALKRSPIETLQGNFIFYWLKFKRIILQRSRYVKSFSVMAPDGAGKTTFLNELIKDLSFYYTKEESYFPIYHFRPSILPNLGAVGEKAGLKKQDKDFTNPHRGKPANFLSSLIRISYYWFDYVVGWYVLTSKDIQYDYFSIFDRYSYDMIVDPLRSSISLPRCVRAMYVKCMPHPKMTLYIDVEPDEIYRRKQELEPDEIRRQISEYKKIIKSGDRFIAINGNNNVEEMVKNAVSIVLDKYAIKIQ